MRRLVGGALSRVRDRAGGRSTASAPLPTPPSAEGTRLPVPGLVEQFSRRLVVGWVSVPANTPPAKVTLHLGRLQVAATYTTPGSAMSGVNSTLRRAGDAGADDPGDMASSAELVHAWQVRNVPGPPDDRRNSGQQIHTFSFRVRDIWSYVKKTTQVRVRVDGHPLPIYGHGMFLRPPKNGKHSLAELERKFDEGYLFSQYGELQLSKRLDVEWQKKVIDLYHEVRQFLSDDFGYDLWLVGGTLLGAVREGGHLGHDIDCDVAYSSRETTGEGAAAEMVRIGLALVARGMDVQCMTTALHIHDPQDPSSRIDLFHTYFDEDDLFAFPWGIAGTSTVHRSDWKGTRQIDFPGGWALVPDNAEQMVEHLYGADWRLPKPGFNWNLDRTKSAPEGRLTAHQRSTVHWASFYAQHAFSDPSSFFGLVEGRADTPHHIIDIGCGDGRDSCAFAAAGREVLAIDQAEIGIEHGRQHAERDQVADRVRFEVLDLADADAFDRLLSEHLAGVGGPVMFYLRFLLNSLTLPVQQEMMRVLRERSRPGDLLAVEFRTVEDGKLPKAYRKHYCRFLDADELAAELDGSGFSIVHTEQGTGLSPHEGEDPFLYRAVARR